MHWAAIYVRTSTSCAGRVMTYRCGTLAGSSNADRKQKDLPLGSMGRESDEYHQAQLPRLIAQ